MSESKPSRTVRAEPESAELARALKCAPCSQRDNVIANIKAGAYARPDDLEADLLVLEAMPAE